MADIQKQPERYPVYLSVEEMTEIRNILTCYSAAFTHGEEYLKEIKSLIDRIK